LCETLKGMTRYREVKKYGNSLAIALTSSDLIDLNIKIGDQIDIDDAVRKKSVPLELKKMVKKIKKGGKR